MKRIIILSVLVVLSFSLLFAGGIVESSPAATSIITRSDAVSSYLQSAVAPYTISNGTHILTVVPALSESFVLMRYPEMNAKRFSLQQMSEVIKNSFLSFEFGGGDESGRFTMILRLDPSQDLMSSDSFTVDEEFLDYVFLDNDRGEFLRVGSHSIIKSMKVEPYGQTEFEFWVRFGHNDEERKAFYRDVEKVSITITDFGFENQNVELSIPLSAVFQDMPEGPRKVLDICQLEREKLLANGSAGGLIFFDKGSYLDGWRYLEVAPDGWSETGDDPKHIFGYYRNPEGYLEAVGTAETEIGTGSANTITLVAAMGDSAYINARDKITSSDYAAKFCNDYTGGGYNDWFLPSKDELDLMIAFLKTNELISNYSGFYWSSSELASSDFSWTQGTYSGNMYNYTRNNSYKVRPIRAF